MDRIFIEGLRLRGKQGVTEEERQHEQEFLLDIAIHFETKPAARSDELADTVDYNFFRDAAKEVVEKRSVKLLERLADDVAQMILEDRRISRVEVSVRKTEMFDDCTPGVTIVRER